MPSSDVFPDQSGADNSPQRRYLTPLEEKVFCSVVQGLVTIPNDWEWLESADAGKEIGELALKLTDSILKSKNLC